MKKCDQFEVVLANEDSLMLRTHVLCVQGVEPLWLKCIAQPAEGCPPCQVSVVRCPGEAARPFWERALEVIRAMKIERGLMHPVTVHCMTTPPPAKRAIADERATAELLLLYLAEYSPRAEVQLAAIDKLAELWGIPLGPTHAASASQQRVH